MNLLFDPFNCVGFLEDTTFTKRNHNCEELPSGIEIYRSLTSHWLMDIRSGTLDDESSCRRMEWIIACPFCGVKL
jgi:hypothetical protein